MRSKILPAILLLLFWAPSAFAFQNANRKPTPKPKPSAGAPTKPTPKPTASVPAKPGQTSAALKKEVVPLTDRVFTWPAVVFLFVMGVIGFGLGAGVGAASLGDNQAAAAMRGLEALILAVIGGLLARLFIALLIWLGNDSAAVEIAVGWFFFLIPGLVDTFAYLINGETVTSPDFLIWMGTAIGSFTGLMNGLWKIHNWKGLGWLAFPLDVTWGLAGAMTASLLHLINFAWAGHASETRREAHRYLSGARLKGTFALTQGPVMSNLKDGPGIPLYHHERTHVWQNRSFGPLFMLSYLGWMAVWVIPGIIAAIWTKDAEAIQSWCYYNNPWETWAYRVGAGPRTGRHPLIWGDLVIALLSLPFFAGMVSLLAWAASEAW